MGDAVSGAVFGSVICIVDPTLQFSLPTIQSVFNCLVRNEANTQPCCLCASSAILTLHGRAERGPGCPSTGEWGCGSPHCCFCRSTLSSPETPQSPGVPSTPQHPPTTGTAHGEAAPAVKRPAGSSCSLRNRQCSQQMLCHQPCCVLNRAHGPVMLIPEPKQHLK